MGKGKEDLLSSIEAIKKADNDLDVKKHDAIIKANLDMKQKTFPHNFLSPLGAAVISGCVAIAVVIMNNNSAEGRSEDDHHRQVDRQDLNIMTQIMSSDNANKNKYICAYFDYMTKSDDQYKKSVFAIHRVAHYVVDNEMCGTDGNGIGAFTVRENDSDKERRGICAENVEKIVASCVASDRAGFHAKPYGSCDLELKAPEGKIFGKPVEGKPPISIDHESYRRLYKDESVFKNVKVATYHNQHTEYPTHITSSIACTNTKGTGRTCEASATISAYAFDTACIGLYEAETTPSTNAGPG